MTTGEIISSLVSWRQTTGALEAEITERTAACLALQLRPRTFQNTNFVLQSIERGLAAKEGRSKDSSFHEAWHGTRCVATWACSTWYAPPIEVCERHHHVLSKWPLEEESIFGQQFICHGRPLLHEPELAKKDLLGFELGIETTISFGDPEPAVRSEVWRQLFAATTRDG